MTYYEQVLKQFLLSLVGFAVLDGVWLGLLMSGFYRRHLATVARLAGDRLDPIWPVAALVYPTLAAGLTIFVLSRARSPLEALTLGALYGLCAYGLYDLTNHATLRDWPAVLTVVDISWGVVICGTTAWAVSMLTRSA
ncbi:MAG: DUF2177 family protein [Acidobacteriota bacterium]